MQIFSATPALVCVAIVCAVYGDDTIYPVVQTKNGPVRGVQLRVNVNNTTLINTFRGIPFAANTEGPNRSVRPTWRIYC